jgi:FkbM family methyltransferase
VELVYLPLQSVNRVTLLVERARLLLERARLLLDVCEHRVEHTAGERCRLVRRIGFCDLECPDLLDCLVNPREARIEESPGRPKKLLRDRPRGAVQRLPRRALSPHWRRWRRSSEALLTVSHTIDEPSSRSNWTSLRRLLGAGLQPELNPRRGTSQVPGRRALGRLISPLRRVAAPLQKRSTLPRHLLGHPSKLEAVSRQEARAVYLGEQTMLCRVLGKYLIYADAQETGITPHLCLDGFWESWITVALARTLRRGWHCLDIGANHGYYTLIMADAVGYRGRVLPVEPTPRLAELLRQTLDVNGFPRLTVVQEAASHSDGKTLQLVVPARRSLNAHLSEVAGPTDARLEVRSVTIDALTREWPRVDLVKIDVEGAEEDVWQGMQRTIARNRSLVVMLELNVARYNDARSFLRAIELEGFPLRYVDIDAKVKDVAINQLLTRRVGEDWMLYLTRG